MPNSEIGFILLLIVRMGKTQDMLPKTYDASIGWENCAGFSHVLNQGHNCSSCCAMALSSALSARDCMRDGRNILYSAKQIWDCTAYDNTQSCENGTYFSEMLDAMVKNFLYAKVLISDSCSLYVPPYDPAPSSTCTQNYEKCERDPDGASFLYSSVYANELRLGIRGFGVLYNGNVAARALMAEILVNGPVVAILDMKKSDFEIFGKLKSDVVFVPTFSQSMIIGNTSRHCIMVYGWGQDNQTGLDYWLVQNSYGTAWGLNGRGKIIRGSNWLENEWRGISTRQRPCTSKFCMTKEAYNLSRALNMKQISLSNNHDIVLKEVIETYLKKMLFEYKDEVIIEPDVWKTGGVLSNSEIVAITFCSSFFLISVSFWVVKNYMLHKDNYNNYDKLSMHSNQDELHELSKTNAKNFVFRTLKL